jgi:hypothetical protein
MLFTNSTGFTTELATPAASFMLRIPHNCSVSIGQHLLLGMTASEDVATMPILNGPHVNSFGIDRSYFIIFRESQLLSIATVPLKRIQI